MDIHVVWNMDLSEIANIKLEDMLCKHVLNIASDKAKRMLEESKNIGYPGCMWGYYHDHSNVRHQLGIIERMEEDDYTHSIRVVICSYEHTPGKFIWTDNLHTTIKAIREKGRDARLRDVPFYVVDVSDKEHVIVYDYNRSLHDDMVRIRGAVDSARFRLMRSDSKDLLQINYTVKDFLEDNPDLLKKK